MTESTDPAAVAAHRSAVAIHEAAHAVVGAYLGFEVPELRMMSKGGHTSGGQFAGERVDLLAVWPAGDAAVEEICGGYRLPIDTGPNSDQEMFRWAVREITATDHEQRQAQIKAREIVRGQRMHIITIAMALFAAKDGHLSGEELERLLEPVRAAS